MNERCAVNERRKRVRRWRCGRACASRRSMDKTEDQPDHGYESTRHFARTAGQDDHSGSGEGDAGSVGPERGRADVGTVADARHGARAHRDRGDVGPLPGCRIARRVLGPVGRRAFGGPRDSGVALGCRAVLRPAAATAGQGLLQMVGHARRGRIFRSAVLRHLARGSDGDGPAAPVVPAGKLSCVRRRGLCAVGAGRRSLRRLPRHHEQRVRQSVPAGRRRHRRSDG